MKYPNLFSPIKLDTLEIPNRTVLAPMGTRIYSNDETWPKRTIRYFEERARGETGLLITNFVRVHDSLASFPIQGIYDDRFIPTHAEMAERIHRYDSKIFLQIALSGGRRSNDAPSAIYNDCYLVKPRELTTDELDELVESFITAAGRAREAGYDGVELHGAHSYLVGQMVSPALNKRNDKYGGSFEGRMKFPVDVITGIRNRYPGFPVGYKVSAHEEIEGGVDISLAKDISIKIAAVGAAYIHVAATSSSLGVYSKYPSVPILYSPRNALLPLAEAIKAVIPGTPVMATGSITVPEEAEAFIETGKCDMVALGRTTFADPHWARKAKAGQRVTPCIRCNECYHHPDRIRCSVNPYLLLEASQELSVPSRLKRVMIVGAGPAGIRCALTASKRGHDVILYEKKSRIGGMVYPGSRPECKQDVRRLLDWYEAEIAESRISLKLDTEVTAEMIEQEAPDALVIASGAEPVIPNVNGIDKPHVTSAVDVLTDISSFSGQTAVVIGGGDVGCETACHFLDNGWKVTIVEMLPVLMADNQLIGLKDRMLVLLQEKGVTVMTGTSLTAVTDEGVEVCLPNGKAWGLNADLAVMATGFRSPGLLERSRRGVTGNLASKADEVHIIGDCNTPGRICTATEAGERTGRWL
ncbi:FAD-dependent oxidoreductase [Candidatus Latescibacterota bacterium]